MIALTQEKREELVEWIHEHIEFLKQDDKSTYARNSIISLEIALASLTAESIAHADSKAILKMIKGHTRFFTSFPERSETKRVGLFIAPPVQEIKLPSINRYEKYLGTLAEDAWRDCIEEIKRLNGLG